MAGKIFINYRRDDAPDSTGRLYDRLEDEFKAEDIFMDVEGHIKPGDDFVEVLNLQVSQCDVLLAIIGPKWSELLAARANDPDDFVAIEIKAALDKGKRVIPVLVGGAPMPRADSLPPVIQALARRNALGLRPERFKADCQSLVTALKEQLEGAEAERNARTAAERAAAEAARRKAEEEAAARAQEAERRARAQEQAGLSPEQIMKAEELANWDFVKESSDPQEFRDHLARFPKGVVERNARTKLEALLWTSIANAASDDAFAGERLASFLNEFPDGKFAAEAKAMQAGMAERAKQAADQLARLTAERDAWAEASRVNTVEAFKKFREKWPNGENAGAANARINELRGSKRRFASSTILVTSAIIGLGFAISVKKPDPISVPPKVYTLADAETRFSVVNKAIKAKKAEFNLVAIEGQEREKTDGTYESPLDPECKKDQRGMSALRGMAIVFALYGLASNGLVESGNDIPSIAYPDDELNKLALKDKEASWNTALMLRTKLPSWIQNSPEIRAFVKELLAYKSKFDEKEKVIDWSKKSADADNIGEILGDPKSDKPCFNGVKYLNVGTKSKEEAVYRATYGVINPHGYFYSFWYRRKLEGSMEFAEKFLKFYASS